MAHSAPPPNLALHYILWGEEKGGDHSGENWVGLDEEYLGQLAESTRPYTEISQHLSKLHHVWCVLALSVVVSWHSVLQCPGTQCCSVLALSAAVFWHSVLQCPGTQCCSAVSVLWLQPVYSVYCPPSRHSSCIKTGLSRNTAGSIVSTWEYTAHTEFQVHVFESQTLKIRTIPPTPRPTPNHNEVILGVRWKV